MTLDRDDAAHRHLAADVLDYLLEGCQVITFDFSYLYVNEAAARQGRRTKPDLVGRTMMECYPGIEATPMFEQLRRCLSERGHHRMENEFKFPDGSTGWFELRFEPIPQGVCILSLDITETKRSANELRRTEEQLRQAQKMEAVGRLAGGVSHDFNNILSVLLSYAEMIVDDLQPEEPLRADIEEIRRAALRATELTRQLLAFSRQQVLDVIVMNLNQSVAGMEKILRRVLGPTSISRLEDSPAAHRRRATAHERTKARRAACDPPPEMKVLYMSGYTDESILQHGVLDSGVAYLQRPLTVNSLSQKVREVLNSGG
jgi:PAS domain S-box-containing protein